MSYVDQNAKNIISFKIASKEFIYIHDFKLSSSEVILEDSFIYACAVRSLGTSDNQREYVSVMSVFLPVFPSCYFPIPSAFSVSYRTKLPRIKNGILLVRTGRTNPAVCGYNGQPFKTAAFVRMLVPQFAANIKNSAALHGLRHLYYYSYLGLQS